MLVCLFGKLGQWPGEGFGERADRDSKSQRKVNNIGIWQCKY